MNSLSSQDFFQKLSDKDKQKTHLLYQDKDKENVSAQHVLVRPRKNRRSSAQCSTLPASRKGQGQGHWLLDHRDCAINQPTHQTKVVNNWICFRSGIVEFQKIVEADGFQKQLDAMMQGKQLFQEMTTNRSITIKIWQTSLQASLVSTLTDYALPLLKYGKGTWSVAALTANKRFDLLSLDVQGSILWKSKKPLSKVQLEREQLLRRVFGFSGEKEKDIGEHEVLAKLQLLNGTTVYFIVRYATLSERASNAELMVEQEIVLENVNNAHTLALVRARSDFFEKEEKASSVLSRLQLKVRREEEMSKQEREEFLKALISQLQGELVDKQQELQQYRQKKEDEEEQEIKDEEEEMHEGGVVDELIGIPSERISAGQERYMHLRRRIRQSKII